MHIKLGQKIRVTTVTGRVQRCKVLLPTHLIKHIKDVWEQALLVSQCSNYGTGSILFVNVYDHPPRHKRVAGPVEAEPWFKCTHRAISGQHQEAPQYLVGWWGGIHRLHHQDPVIMFGEPMHCDLTFQEVCAVYHEQRM